MSKPIIIGIAGGSGTGKSTYVANKIKNLLDKTEGVVIISQDNFRKSKQYKLKINSKYKWDDPRMFSIKECLNFLSDAETHKPWKIPIYNNQNFSRTGFQILNPTRYIIFEGIYALSKNLQSIYQLKIYIEAPLYARMIKRVVRGVKKYKYHNCDKLLAQIFESVLIAHKKFVIKQARFADLIIKEKFDFEFLIKDYNLKPLKEPQGNNIYKVKLQNFLILKIIKNSKYYFVIKYKNTVYLKFHISENTFNLIQKNDLFSN